MTESQSHSNKRTPWDFIGEEERRLLGDVITSREEQTRWCKAMVFGTLPYMWREKASVVGEPGGDKHTGLNPERGQLLAGDIDHIGGGQP